MGRSHQTDPIGLSGDFHAVNIQGKGQTQALIGLWDLGSWALWVSRLLLYFFPRTILEGALLE